jgi:hypothetical protein
MCWPRGTQARDYRTSIQQPRFDFMGGNDGEVAVLFRDVNGNNRFDSGDVELGRKTIGPDSVIQYKTGINVSEANKSGHFVEVNAASALPNTTYADIKVVLQTASGTFGTASAAAIGGLTVFNNAPLPPLTRVQTSQNTPTDPTAETTLSFDITGGKVGAPVKFMADLTDSNGAMITAGVVVGQGLLVAGKVNINTAALNGTYRNFKAVQTYAGQDSSAVDVVKQDGTGLTMTWDHIAPTVQVALKPGTVAHSGQPVELLFTFSENVKDFTKDDITVVGGQIDSVTGTGSTRTAIFTPDNVTSSGASVEVKAGSYKNKLIHLTGNFVDQAGNQEEYFQPGDSMKVWPRQQIGDVSITDPDGTANSVYSYKWYLVGTDGNSQEISRDHYKGSDSSTLVVTSDLLGKGEIKAELNFNDERGHRETIRSSTGISPELPSSFNAIPLSFTGVTAPANSPRLVLVDKDRSLYLLDVNGDNAIDQRDATTYITNLDASGGLTVQGQNGQVRATLLDKDSDLWVQLALGSTAWGSATGVKGSYGNSAADDVPAQDFWTATANGSSAHYVWATPASGGIYSSANASGLGDPTRQAHLVPAGRQR